MFKNRTQLAKQNVKKHATEPESLSILQRPKDKKFRFGQWNKKKHPRFLYILFSYTFHWVLLSYKFQYALLSYKLNFKLTEL